MANRQDMFTVGVVDVYTSTFHSLDDINYPEHFWKAIIENEREKLINRVEQKRKWAK